MSRIVIALGGNALGNTPQQQKELVEQTVVPIAELIENGESVVIVHGNGPQVGMINLAMSSAAESGVIAAEMPFPECGAMSQGYIGYHLQNALQAELKRRNIAKEVCTLVTQVEVREDDPAFSEPTKPIGSFYSQEKARALAEEKGFSVKEDAGRGWRRVVASPKPVDIVELGSVRTLMEAGQVVICCGGGGIPVVRKGLRYLGVPAVIDKDAAAAKLAERIDADILIILTAVQRVAINFGKPDQLELDSMTPEEAESYCAQGHFAPGSMLPKVRSSIEFVRSGEERTAIIAALSQAGAAIRGESGTSIRSK